VCWHKNIEQRGKHSKTQQPMRHKTHQSKQNKPIKYPAFEMIWLLIALASLLVPTIPVSVVIGRKQKTLNNSSTNHGLRKTGTHNELRPTAKPRGEYSFNTKNIDATNHIATVFSTQKSKYSGEFTNQLGTKKSNLMNVASTLPNKDNKQDEIKINLIYLEYLKESLSQHIINYKYLSHLTTSTQLKNWIEQKIIEYSQQQKDIQSLQEKHSKHNVSVQ